MSVQARQIAVQARQIHEADRGVAKFIALRIAPADCGVSEVSAGIESWPVVGCESPLAVRDAMRRHASAPTPVVLLYGGEQSDLGADVVGRCAKRRLFAPDLWQVVMTLFRASQIDPRLAGHPWLAELLVRFMPPEGYAPVLSVTLDQERAWKEIYVHVLGFDHPTPSLLDLFRWALDAGQRERYLALDRDAKAQVCDRLAESVGPAATYVMAAIDCGRADDLLAAGLICEALVPGCAGLASVQAQVAARLEVVFSGKSLDAIAIGKLAGAAGTLFQGLTDAGRKVAVERFESLLAAVKAEPLAPACRYGEAGLKERIKEFAQAVAQLSAERARDGLVHLSQHRWPSFAEARLDRALMAANLVASLLAERTAEGEDLSALARRYQDEIAWIDWARSQLLDGDDSPELAAAYAHLRRVVRAIREPFDREFAMRLDRDEPDKKRLLGIEFALDRCIAPVIEAGKTLLIVVDGMSMAVFLEIARSMQTLGWIPCELPADTRPALLTMLPSTTEASRTSLLAGCPRRGDAAYEKAAFGEHSSTLAHSVAGKPPRLFHKAELFHASGVSLGDSLLQALRDARQRLVGVVLNAVDDHLAKSEQLRLRWSIDQFRGLDAMLAEARSGERTVIVTSDHGHVLDQDSELCGNSPNARWREPNLELRDGEIELRGPRVQAACGLDRVVLPWRETIRYASRRNGYHGGCSPAEAVVPFATFRFSGSISAPWATGRIDAPTWWQDRP